MIAAGITSGRHAGLAVVAGEPGRERLLWHGETTFRTGADVTEAVRTIGGFGLDLAAVEEPFPGAGHDTIVLSRLLGRWLQALDSVGLSSATVRASLWMRAVLPGYTPTTRSADLRTAAVVLTRERFQVDVVVKEAEAIAIALFALRHVSIRRPEVGGRANTQEAT